MVNKEKAVRRELARLRKTQNPQQVDFRRMRQLRKARTKFWATKTVGGSKTIDAVKVKKPEKKKEKKKEEKKKKKEKEPELEIIDDEPEFEELEDEPELEEIVEESESEEIDDELEELYSYDEELEDIDEEESD